MKIAVVRSAVNLDYYDRDRELSKKLIEAADTDSRFESTTVNAVAWDEPNDWKKFTHILLTVGLEYYKCHKKFLEWLNGLPEDVQARVFNPPRIIKWNMNKIYLAELKEKGIPLPASVFIPATDSSNKVLHNIIQELEKETGKPLEGVVIKNMMDAGGHSVHRVQLVCQKNGQNILDRAISTYEGGVIVQEYLTNISTEGEWSIVYIDRILSHAMVKLPCASGFKVQRRFGGSTSIVDLQEVPKDVLQLASQVMECVPEEKLLYARIDVVRGNDGVPKLMELEIFEPELYLYNTELSVKFLEAVAKY